MGAVTVARLEAVLGADTDQFDRAMNKSEGRIGKMGKAAALGGLAIAGGLAVGLKKSVDAALESEKAQARLNQALAGAGVSQAKYGKEIEANIQKTSRLAALDDEDLSDAFAKLVRSTGDVTKATEGMNLAADIARARNISLEAATKTVERGLIGNAAAFGKVGVAIVKSSEHLGAAKMEIESWKDSSGKLTEAEETKAKALLDTARTLDKQATAAQAFDAAQRKFADGAKEYGETAAGAQERFGVAVENLQEKIGAKLLPILAKLMELALRVIESIERHWPRIMEVIGPVMEDVRRVISDALEAIQQFWENHGERVIAIVTGIFKYVQGTVENAMKYIQGVIDVFMGVITGDWSRAWDGIKGMASAFFGQLLLMFQTMLPLIGAAAKAVGLAILNGIVDIVKGIASKVWDLTLAIGTKYVEMYATVLGWGFDLASKIVSGVIDGLVGIGTKAWGVIDNIGSVIADMAGTIKGWGSSIINKIVDGIKGAASDLWDAVTGIFDKLPGFVKKILGISSPSKVFMDIGKNLVTGLIKGLESKAGDLRKAAMDMAKSIAGEAWDKLSGVASAAGGAIAGAAGAVGGALGFGGGDGPTTGSGVGSGHVYGDIQGLASSFMQQLMNMSAGHGIGISVQSGFRTYAEQAALVAQKGLWSPSNPTGAAAPGTSKHESGRAADITPGRPSWPFAGRYGLTFPIPKEPWHVESYDRGGWLKPGLTLAYNGLGVPERVGGGGNTYNIYASTMYGDARGVQNLVRTIRTEIDRTTRRN